MKRRYAAKQTCEWCGTVYDVPKRARVCVETTMDLPPPAHCVVWDDDPRMGRFDQMMILHECRRGVPRPSERVAQ